MEELKNMTYGELKGLRKAFEQKGFTFKTKEKSINVKDFDNAINAIVDELNKEQNKNNKFYNIPKA